MKIFKFIATGFVSLLLFGCSSVSGPIIGYSQDTNVDKDSLAIIHVSPEIDVLEVNGIETKTPFIEEGYNEIHIPPGANSIAIEYLKFWGDVSSGAMLRSKPVVLDINVAPKGRYFVKYKVPEDVWAAIIMTGDFSPWIESAAGKKVAYVRKATGKPTLIASRKSGTENQQPTGSGPLENLKFWWQKAGYKEKKVFEKWMNENTESQKPTGSESLDNLKAWWNKAGYKEKKDFEKWMNDN